MPSSDPADAHRPFTVADLLGPAHHRGQLLRTPALAIAALKVVHEASPRQLFAMLSLQLAAAVGVALQLLIAREFMQTLIDVSAGGAASDLYLPLAYFAAASVGVAAARAGAEHRQRLLGEMVGRHAFDRIIAAASAAEYEAFESPRFYDELQRAMSSGELRILDLVNSLSQLTAALITTIGIAAVLFGIEPLLLVLTVAAGVPALFAAVHNSRRMYVFDYAMTPESRERAYVLNLLTGRSAAKEVRLLNLAPHLRKRYERLTDERIRRLRSFLARRLRVSLVGAFAGAIGLTLALTALVLLLAGGRIDVAAALTAGVAMQQLAGRLTSITASIAKLLESGMFLDDYRDFVAIAEDGGAAPEPAPCTDGAPARAGSGPGAPRLALDRVSFTYPSSDVPALRDISLEIEPGERVALVGCNGSGKTTLVKLIAQLYRPDSGRVLWNGDDAATLAPEEITDETTVLFQDYLEYHLTALDNIAFGRHDRDATREALVDAAERAGAHDFLERLPDGYGTRLGLQFHGGHELSVGQWQRLALARAFYRGGSFLILDEPTASLDPRAERDLFEQMHTLARGRSVLLISHRFSSVRSADRIYVLDDGRIVEHGNHAALMSLGGLYAEMFELQATAYLPELEQSSVR